MIAIRPVWGFVAALALSWGTAIVAQAQTFCASYPCYQVNVYAQDGPGSVVQFNPDPFSLFQSGSSANGNQEQAFGRAQFNSVGSSAWVSADVCPPSPLNCFAGVQADSAGFYWDQFDLRTLGHVDGDMLQFTLALDGTFGFGPDAVGTTQAAASLLFINGSNVGSGGLSGNSFFPPLGSTVVSVRVDPTLDPYGYLVLGVDTETFLSPALGSRGIAFADFSTTFSITDVALLDPEGNFLRDIVLTDTAGFTLPGPGPTQPAPEPATLLLVAGALAMLGRRRLHVRGVSDL